MVKESPDVPDGMRRVYRRFERWRRSHPGRLPFRKPSARRRRWWLGNMGFQTVKVLSLEYVKLKRMAESAPGSAPGGDTGNILGTGATADSRLSECLIEFEGTGRDKYPVETNDRIGLFGTSPFDEEDAPTRRKVMIENRMLKSYLLNTYAARNLGLRTTGNASHSLAGDAGVGNGNLHIQSGGATPGQMIAGIRDSF